MKSFFNSPYVLWCLLSVPAISFLYAVSTGASPEGLLHPTGEFSARFMIIAMMVTPLRMLFPAQGWTLWMVQRRRYLGVAAFAYAALHTIFYLIDMQSPDAVLADALRAAIWTGWIAFFIFVPLAMTSNDASVRWLRRKWKPLQRWVYPAAVLTLAHWALIDNNLGPALVHFAPLIALEAYRIWKMTAGKQAVI